MATGKRQLSICAILIGIFNSSSICMDKQECIFDTLPLELQEQVIELLPANNLYRVLWSRCYNASQNFYDAIAKAYLELHFVPQEYIGKTIAKDFVYFRGCSEQKQNFQNKIERALTKHSQCDTDLFAVYKQSIADSRVEHVIHTLFSSQIRQQLEQLINSTENERADILLQLQANSELCQVKKRLQKYLSCITCCHACLYFSAGKKMLTCTMYTLYILNRWLQSRSYKTVKFNLGYTGLVCGLISGVLAVIKNLTTDISSIRDNIRVFEQEGILYTEITTLSEEVYISLDELSRYFELIRTLPVACIDMGILGNSISDILKNFTDASYREIGTVCENISISPLYGALVCLVLLTFAKFSKHSVFWIHEKLRNSSYNYLVVYSSQFEELQTKISRALNAINEFEKA